VVICAVKHGIFDVADQVLEKRANNNVDNVADFDVHRIAQRCARMELLKFDAASDVLLGAGLVELVEGVEGELVLVDVLVEIERDVVH